MHSVIASGAKAGTGARVRAAGRGARVRFPRTNGITTGTISSNITARTRNVRIEGRGGRTVTVPLTDVRLR